MSNAILRLGEAYVGLLIDKSDSMAGVKAEVVRGVAEQARVLLETATERTHLLVETFSDNVNSVYDGEVPGFRIGFMEGYAPNGMTALMDGVGTMLRKMEPRVHDPRHRGAPATGLMVIFTDGEENVSRDYEPEGIRSWISKLRETGLWTFILMGPEETLDRTCQALGISRANARPFDSQAEAARRGFAATSTALTGYMDARQRGVASSEDVFAGVLGSGDEE